MELFYNNKPSEQLKVEFDLMTDQERIEFVADLCDEYCMYCGKHDKRCNCMNFD